MSERKYRQHGYQDSPAREKRTREPRAPRETIGPRLPQFPARVTVARCANCGALQPRGFDPQGQCKCGFELHSCKQCVHFDTSARWECTQAISARVSPKDARNECTFHEIRLSSEKETTSGQSSGAPASRSPDDPRKAFENLFKK